MKLTAITCTTPERHEAFALCTRYVARQTRQPDQWLVLDGPEPMHQKLGRAIAENRIEGDCVLFTEDDDWFGPRWFAWCERHLERGFDIVGQGRALFYNVRHRWWNNCGNVRHAELLRVPLSSVDQDSAGIGRQAAALALEAKTAQAVADAKAADEKLMKQKTK